MPALGFGTGIKLGDRAGLSLGEGGGYDPVVALGSKLFEYWDPDIPGQLTLNGSEVVTFASGKTGLAPTQATATARPTFNATALNGRAGLLYNSANSQQLTVGGVGSLPTGASTCEVWLVCSQTALAGVLGGKVAFSWGNGGVTGAYRSIGRVSAGTNRVNVVMGTGAADISVTGSVVDLSGGVFLIRARMEAAQILGYVNGMSEGASAGTLGGTATTRTRFGAYPNAGGAAFWDGYIGPTYVTDLLSGEEVGLLSYFQARYGF